MSLAVHRFAPPPAPRAARRIGLAAAVALHAAAGTAVLAYEPARTALSVPATIAVEWISAPQTAEPVKEARPVQAPKPKPVHHATPARIDPKPTPTPVVPPPAAEPEPVAAPAAPPPRAAVASIAPAAPIAQPVPVTPPIFNADYLANPAPTYPALSRRVGEQGRVVLRVHVTPAGTVDGAEVRTSSGHSRLDDSALETVKRWKFVPAKQGTQPIAAWVLVPISFGLDS